MLKSEFSTPVHGRSNNSIPSSSTTVGTEPSTTDSPLQLNSNPSLWKLPGLDKDTFYAAALYLHAATGGLEARPWYRGPATPAAIRDFLDRLADCFARSKGRDARDHVSATAMVRNVQQKKIRLYIAKNQSYTECESRTSQVTQNQVENENEKFAKMLVDWFNRLAKDGAVHDKLEYHWSVFKEMCNFSCSRLEYYIEGISKFDIDDLERVVLLDLNEKFGKGWKEAKIVAEKCKRYQDSKVEQTPPCPQSPVLESVAIKSCAPNMEQDQTDITTCAKLAGEIRKSNDFLNLADAVRTSLSESKLDNLAKFLKWINYFGRLYAAYVGFWEFCKGVDQREYCFSYQLLPSKEDEWIGHTYAEKIQSWIGDLRLTDELRVKKYVDGRIVSQNETVKQRMDEIVKTRNRARVHCEMQLMMHFLQQETKDVLDYFGCSKKSCWLCWQLMSQNAKFSIKDTHRKLYPLWAFPFEFSPLQPAVAEGLRSAYHDMLYLIQDMVIKQTTLSSADPYVQSSARLSPSFRRDRVIDSIGSGLILGDSPMSVEYAPLPIGQVPVLRFPAFHQDLQRGDVYVYETDSSRIWQNLLTYEYYSNRDVFLAFQLIKKPDSLCSTSDVDEFQQLMWCTTTIPRWLDESKQADLDRLDYHYRIYFRSATDTLKPNAYLARIWGETHQQVPEVFPWRGDVFVTCSEENPLEARRSRKFSEVDESDFSTYLRRYFKNCRADYATELWANIQESATRNMEYYKSCMQTASKQPDHLTIGLNRLY